MSDSAVAERELSPPDQSFWKRYSPLHECPIAGSASMLVHLLALGGVVLAGLAMSWRWYGDTAQPPAMSVVYVEGGDGRPVGGGGNGMPKSGVTENVDVGPQSPQPPLPTPSTQAPLVLPPKITSGNETEIVVPKFDPKNNDSAFAKVQEGLKNPAVSSAKPAGDGGDGGGAGGGKGTGIGPGNGPGNGTGPAVGSAKALRAQILANRWHFDSSGSPRERIAKFAAVGITLGFSDLLGNDFIIVDLKKRPVNMIPDSFRKRAVEGTVMWNAGSDKADLPGFARELGLPLVPTQFVLLLPPDREQKMADEEMRYAREKGHDFSKVEGTLFDFVLTRGIYEPVAKGQAPFDWKLPSGKGRAR